MAEIFERLHSEAMPVRPPQGIEPPRIQLVEQMQESHSQFQAQMDDLAEVAAATRRAGVEREEAMLRALETVAAELEKAREGEVQAAVRERWMLRLAVASMVLAAVAAVTGVLAQFAA